MRLSQVYRKAARIADRGVAACHAIHDYVVTEPDYAIRSFCDLFRPDADEPHESFPGDVYWWGVPWRCSEQDHNARVLALLFMAEIAKDTERESALSAD